MNVLWTVQQSLVQPNDAMMNGTARAASLRDSLQGIYTWNSCEYLTHFLLLLKQPSHLSENNQYTWNHSKFKWTKLRNPPYKKITPHIHHLLLYKLDLLLLSEHGINALSVPSEFKVPGYTPLIAKHYKLNPHGHGRFSLWQRHKKKQGTWPSIYEIPPDTYP